MNKLWIVAFIVILAGCHGSSSSSPAQISAACNASNTAGDACFANESQQFTGEDFGDSISLGWTAYARHNFCGVIDFRHNAFDSGNDNLCGILRPYAVGRDIADGYNNGYSFTELQRVEDELANTNRHLNVITFNSGFHDMQRSPKNPNNRLGLADYRNNLEAIAQILEQHADIVIWVDTTPISGNRAYAGDTYNIASDIPIYNAVGEQVAREHGFYILNWSGNPEHDSRSNENVHFSQSGYEDLAQQVTDCVYTALNQEQSARCHH